MNCKLLCALCCVLFSCLSQKIQAQDVESKLPLAILPFIASKGAEINNTGNLN